MTTAHVPIAVGDEVASDLVPEGPSTGGTRAWAKAHYRQIALVGSFFAMIIFFWIKSPSSYATSTNIQNLINGMPVLAMMGIAVTVVLVLGEFDLSVPAVASLVCVI